MENRSNGSFHLSLKHDDVESIIAYSDDPHTVPITQDAVTQGFNLHTQNDQDESDLITSDSDFDKAAEAV